MYDIILRGGNIYDGTGSAPYVGDIAIQSDTIAAIGDLSYAAARREINAKGLAVAPGFINMLSFADRTLLIDGRSMSDIKQGVTLEVFGEGWSPGPAKRESSQQADSLWTTLGGYFDWVMRKGVSPNVASFVGHTSVRNCVMGYDRREPTESELSEMRALVAEAMEDGALGLGTSLIYPPASYASTAELIALAKVASQYGGIYTTHMRSEGDFIVRALNETFRIAKEASIPVDIYHLKISIERNWNKIDTLLFKIDSARQAGLHVTANMYPYVASGTGLNARLPDWIQEGGAKVMRKRLKDPAIRRKVLYEMRHGIPYKNSDPADVMLLDFEHDELDSLYKGKRLDEVAKLYGKDPDETALDLIVKDKSRIEAIYFLISEENLRRIIQLPYVSFGSDAASLAPTEMFADWSVHPRAYGTFARVLAKYVREEKLIPLSEAIRRMTSLPASNLKIQKRGKLKTGYYADIVAFDSLVIQDNATFDNPQQFASGMVYVLVNGTLVLDSGAHTGARPGRVIYGRGRKENN